MVIAVRKTENLLDGFVMGHGKHVSAPVPLKSASYDIGIVSGLAVVKQTRVFRNEEAQPIEATLTFPVGYDSIVSDVRATVSGRPLVGVAKKRKDARETYEKALDDGKATVLHEELMRGLHMLSAGNIAPGEEIVVVVTSVAPLSVVSGLGRLRVPMTIGAIYGTSPLIPSDDIVADGVAFDAAVTVHGADGIKVNGRPASEVAVVRTSAVIDITVPLGHAHPLQARMPSGSWAKVAFGVPEEEVSALDVDLLLDTSGSMAESRHGVETKWRQTIAGLSHAFGAIGEADRFRFWTFSNECHLRGEAVGHDAAAALRGVPFDNGGTRLAEAVHAVAASRSEANILLVTDGRSHTEIDFDRIRKSGARFTVVLIGRASFESRVAQLAALTGGQMFVVDATDDVASVISAAFLSMRRAGSPIRAMDDVEDEIVRVIGGAAFTVTYGEETFADVEENVSVKAFVAGLAVQALPDEKAAVLAEQVGIVSHLTSIVMVDADGPEMDGVAVNRKVSLAASDEAAPLFAPFAATGGGAMRSMAFASASLSCAAPKVYGAADVEVRRGWNSARGVGMFEQQGADASDARGSGLPSMTWPRPLDGSIRRTSVIRTEEVVGIPVLPSPLVYFDEIGKASFDWTVVAQIVNGQSELSLGAYEIGYVRQLAARPEVSALASSLGASAIRVALALIAKAAGGTDRFAQRIVRKVLDGADQTKVGAALRLIR